MNIKEQIVKIGAACKQIKPLVAIRCITYNHEPYIRDALEGFVMQKTSFPFVAIVHDDASTDGTAAIIREYAEKYPDIILPIYETENQYSNGDGSITRIMNAAVEATGAKYIAMCEGDDYWTYPLKLQKQVDFLETHPDYSMCFHEANIKNEASIPFEYMDLEDREYTAVELYRNWIVPTASMVMIAEVIDYPKDKDFLNGDILIVINAARLGKTYGIHKKMSVYRVQENGLTLSRQKDPIGLYSREIKHHRALYKHFPIITKKERSSKICDDYINWGVTLLKRKNILGMWKIIKGFIVSPTRFHTRILNLFKKS